MKYDVIVIGMGPAGVSAGIYTARAGLKTLVIGRFLESKLAVSHKIHNYFGFKNGIDGKELLKNGIEQAKKLGVYLQEGEVVDVKKKGKRFEIKDSKNIKHKADAVILATGSKNEIQNIKNEKELINNGVHYCAICDGILYKNKKIVVIGNSNHAAEEAIELSAFSKNIKIVSNKDRFAISDELMKQIKNKKIEMIKGEILEFKGEKKLEKIILKDGEVECDAAFIASGTTSSLSIARKLGIEIKNNGIVVNEKQETDMKGVFACGESTGSNKQVAICVGEGSKAAISAIKYLRSKEIYVDYK